MSNSWLIHCNNHLEFFYPPRTGNNPVQLVMCSLFAGHYIFKRKVSVFTDLVYFPSYFQKKFV